MKINIVMIINGFFNMFKEKLGIVSREKKELHKNRLEVCMHCVFLNKTLNVCERCGCFVKAKTKADFDLDDNGKSIDGCPEKYW